MHRFSSAIILGTFILLIMSTYTMAQRRGGFDRARFEEMRARAEAIQTPDVAWLWATLSFDIHLTDEQLPRVKAVLKSTWTQKQTYIADAEQRNADWKLMAEEMREIEKLLDKQIEEILTDDQEKQLKDLKKQRQKRLDTMRPPGR